MSESFIINPACLSNIPSMTMDFVNGATTATPAYTSIPNPVMNISIPYNYQPYEYPYTKGEATMILDATQASNGNIYISGLHLANNDFYYTVTSSFIMQSNETSCYWYHYVFQDANGPDFLHPNVQMYNPAITGIDFNVTSNNITSVGYCGYGSIIYACFAQSQLVNKADPKSITINFETAIPENIGYVFSSECTGVMNGLIVGGIKVQYVSSIHQVVNSFIYDIASAGISIINYPGAVSTMVRDIWYDGGSSYVIVGGYINDPIEFAQTRNFETIDSVLNTGYAFMARWNAITNTTSHWKSFSQDNVVTPGILSIFTKITTDDNGGYNLVAENYNQLTLDPSNLSEFTAAIESGGVGALLPYTGHATASFVNVPTTSTNGFGTAVWTDYTINSNEHVGITASGVIGNTVFGTFNNTGYIAEIL